MKKDNDNQTYKTLGLIMSASVTMGASIFFGYLAGSWLDRQLGTEPWLTLLMFLLGTAAGLKVLYDLAFPNNGDT